MKALVLAAGFGQRLLPYTQLTPKPLFTLGGRPLLDIIIHRLAAAGCTAVAVNTHHLHEKIESFLRRRRYPLPVALRYEPAVLGTGGAIRNHADFWDDRPFLVVNSDIVFDIDLSAAYRYHLKHSGPVTLVLCDDPRFNTVAVDSAGRVLGFGQKHPPVPGRRQLTFTGIQVLDRTILDWIPADGFVDSIDVYRDMLSAGQTIAAFIPEKAFWQDLGTPDRYRQAALRTTANRAFECAGMTPPPHLTYTPMAGDGSDRRWYRTAPAASGGEPAAALVLVDHGIRQTRAPAEVDSFICIGRHLQRQGLPVPRIYAWDRFAGLVFMEDLGSVHLQTRVLNARSTTEVWKWYEQAIDLLIRMSRHAGSGFRPAWAYQSACYDHNLIVHRECGYFLESFVRGYVKHSVDETALAGEFARVANAALASRQVGFMHRDFQSRNLMVRQGRLFLIDFQGGRRGPLEYDLASLLIDPYVGLTQPLQTALESYAARRLAETDGFDPAAFRRSYRGCALARNLQVLGAFSFLSRVKGKKAFESYIPSALQGLHQRLQSWRLPRLTQLVEDIVAQRRF